MSHRTNDLPPLTGLRHSIRELRYHEGSRQALAFVLIALFALVARPATSLLAAGVAIVTFGTLVRLYASGFIVKNEQLATYGPYALVRHPLYTGNILIIIGFSLSSAVWWTAVIALIFFWFYYPTAIEYEDRKLNRIFGAEWERWSARTPALVPTFANFGAVSEGGWSFAKSSRQNGEPIIVAYIVGWVAYLFSQLP
ncbi:MAG TPA: isoprenylcysteine carboxylmethyltransferase family protein [Gammaproteobacteria bacterium]